MEFGLLTLSSDTDKVLKKMWRSRTSLLMNKILISVNALTKWYLLGSIEFLASLICLIIICCFLPAEFWQKYAEVSELTGHVWTSGNYGTSRIRKTDFGKFYFNSLENNSYRIFQANGSASKLVAGAQHAASLFPAVPTVMHRIIACSLITLWR